MGGKQHRQDLKLVFLLQGEPTHSCLPINSLVLPTYHL